jgi:hypothetical protein
MYTIMLVYRQVGELLHELLHPKEIEFDKQTFHVQIS